MITGLYVLEEAKDKVEEVTGLRPTNEKLLKGVRTGARHPATDKRSHEEHANRKNKVRKLLEQGFGTHREGFLPLLQEEI